MKQFMISTFDVINQDIKTGRIISYSKTEIDTSLKVTLKNKEIRGGYLNQKQYEYAYDKELNFTQEDSVFRLEYLALNNGTNINRELNECFEKDEEVEIKNGKGIIKKDCIADNVLIVYEDGETEEVPVTGRNFNSKIQEGKVNVTYMIKEMSDYIDISASSSTQEMKTTLIGKMDVAGKGKREVQIILYRVKPKGNWEINAKADGVTSPKMECSTFANAQGNYAKIIIKDLEGGDNVKISQLSCSESEITLEKGEEKSLMFIGIRGGVYGNIPVDINEITLISDKPSVAKIDNGKIVYIGEGQAVIEAKLKKNYKIKTFIKVNCEKLI